MSILVKSMTYGLNYIYLEEKIYGNETQKTNP